MISATSRHRGLTRVLANPWIIAVAAFAARLGYGLATHVFESCTEPICFGSEAGSIAVALVQGHGFSSPVYVPSGPTALIPPGYPFLLAAICEIFGVRTHAAFVAAYVLNYVATALAVVPIMRVAERIFGSRNALVVGWMWALVPHFLFWGRYLWDHSLATLCLALIFACTLRSAEKQQLRGFILLGALWGITALLNPTLLTLLPFTVGYAMWNWRAAGKSYMRAGLASLITVIIVISPWMVRDRIVMGRWIPIRDSLWLEIAYSNYPGTQGIPFPGRVPQGNPAVRDHMLAIGELNWLDEQRDAVTRYVRTHPREFLNATWFRLHALWDASLLEYTSNAGNERWYICALSLGGWLGFLLGSQRRSRPGAYIVFAGMLLVYPLPYYVSQAWSRYLYCIEPYLLMLSVFTVLYVWDRARGLAPDVAGYVDWHATSPTERPERARAASVTRSILS